LPRPALVFQIPDYASNASLTRFPLSAFRFPDTLSTLSRFLHALSFSFIAGFPDKLRKSAGEAGQDPKGFDRNAMHETLNPEIVAFFNRTLK